MFRVYGCVTEQHDFRLVILAALICFFACYTAFSVVARTRAFEQKSRFGWLVAAAFVTGCGVWATHFIAMLAFRPGMPVGYDFGLTVLSVAIAISLSGLGLYVALYRGGALLGGALMGLAVGAMHYTGMAALRVPALKHWDAVYVDASLLIGVVLAAFAVNIALRLPNLRGRLIAAFLLAAGICGLHFTAMAALTLQPDPLIALPAYVMAPEWLAAAVVAVTCVIVVIALSGSVVDQHLALRNAREAEQLRRHVSELERTQLELEHTTERLQTALTAAAAASEAKSQFLAVMSHELRTPLNAVIGFSELLMRELFGPLGNARYREYIRNISDSSQHLLGMINDILEFSKLDAGTLDLQPVAVDIGKLVQSCAHMMEHQAVNARVRLHIELPPDLPFLHADEKRLRQIIFNLLSNAIKFTPEGGEVRISARLSDGTFAITIADTGIGMKPEDIPKALEHFGQIDSRLSRKYQGTGLGLPLSKRLVELHGGTLSIESAEGAGTTVTIAFPPERVLKELCAA